MKVRSWCVFFIAVILMLSVSGCGTTNPPAATTDTTRVSLGVQSPTVGTIRDAVTPTIVATDPPEVEPTDTAPAPTAAPTNTVEPPTPTTAVNVFEIVQPVTYKPQFGEVLYAVGIIKYTGAETRTGPKISVTLTDATGKVLATTNAIYTPSIIKSNTNIPYKALFNSPPEQFDKIEVNVSAELLEKSFMKELLYGDLEIVEPSLIPAKTDYDYPKVVGRVKNTGTKKANLVGIVGVLYGEDGKVIDVNQTFANIQELEPGADSPFELGFVGVKGGTTFELFTSGHQSP